MGLNRKLKRNVAGVPLVTPRNDEELWEVEQGCVEPMKNPVAYFRKQLARGISEFSRKRLMSRMARGYSRLTSADDVIFERENLLWAVSHRVASGEEIPVKSAAPGLEVAFYHLARYAMPVLVPSAVVDAARVSPMPAHQWARECMPFPLMWLTFDVDCCFEIYEPDGVRRSVQAVLLVNEPGSMGGMFLAGVPGDERKDMSSIALVSGSINWGDEYDVSKPHEKMLAFLFSMMNSPHIEGRSADANRKSSDHHKGIRQTSSVHFVDIPTVGKCGNSEGPSDVEWASRWLVRGHVRNQWYPASHSHRPIWIAPYIKGPADKDVVVHPRRAL